MEKLVTFQWGHIPRKVVVGVVVVVVVVVVVFVVIVVVFDVVVDPKMYL